MTTKNREFNFINFVRCYVALLKMRKCKWFGHKWSKYELIPTLTFRGIPSVVREQKRVCKRCSKTEITYVT